MLENSKKSYVCILFKKTLQANLNEILYYLLCFVELILDQVRHVCWKYVKTTSEVKSNQRGSDNFISVSDPQSLQLCD